MSIWYEGEAADGTHILFTADPYTHRAKADLLYVNHECVRVDKCERFRDGGTTVAYSSMGKFYKPSPLGRKDVATTFDGKVLKQVNRINHSLKKTDLNSLLQRLAAAADLSVPAFLTDDEKKAYSLGYGSALDKIRKGLKL